MIIRGLVNEFRGLQQDEDPWRIPTNSEVGYTYAGRAVTNLSALQQDTVRACVSLIADSLSILPVGSFIKEGKTRRPVDPETPLLENPHPEMDWCDWINRMGMSVVTTGNSYGWITERDRLAYPTAILPMHPDEVRPRRNRDTGQIEYQIPGEKKPVPAFDMMHVRGLTWPGSIVGMSPIEHARQTIGLALAAEEFGARFFGDGANPSGVLETEEKSIDELAGKKVLAKWRANHGNRQRNPALLPKGVKWKPISISPNEAQFLETRRFQKSEICGLFRVKPHQISDVERSTSWGSGIEEQGLEYVTYTMGIWIVRFENALTKLLPKKQYTKFNVSALLRARTLERYQAYLLGRTGGWLSYDDVRELEDMPPIEESEKPKYMQPLNYGPLDFKDIANPEKPEKPTPPDKE